ncbi:MAG: MBL fold metallo-hydrolase [Rhodospirillales bacterium]|nr:MBL fold metallo-hydrolase [Rhodospirillales bacterium]
MSKAFASTGDTEAKTISFTEVGPDLYAFTAEGDPNTGIIIGDNGVMVVDTQATPVMAQQVIERIRQVTDKPVKYVVLSHYHAVRVLGAAAYDAEQIIASETCRAMIHERGQEDWDSEFGRFPRLFQSHQSIPGLTWPTMTLRNKMTVYLGKRRVDLMHLGRAHTAGDIVTWIPDAGVMFSGDIVEFHSACYCGDAHLRDWPITLDRIAEFQPRALAPGRGDALVSPDQVREALVLTRDFVESTYRPVAAAAAAGRSLKEAMTACREHCDPKFGDFAIYEHCLPFNVARAYDEALGIDTPRIWTAERDQAMWTALQS